MPAVIRRVSLSAPGLALTAGTVAAAMVVVSVQLTPLLPIGLALVTVVAGVAVMRPMVTLLMAIAAVPFELLTVDFSGAFGVTPSEGLFVATGLGALGRQLIARRPLVPLSPVGAALALFVFANVPGLLVAADPGAVAKQVVMWSAFFMAFQMIVTTAERKDVRDVLATLAFAGAVVGAYAIATGGIDTPEGTERATGAFGSPNSLGLFLALAIPAQLAFLIRGETWMRPIAALALALSTGGLTLSLSRGAFLAIAAACAVLLLWRPFRRLAAVGLIAVFALTFFGINPAGGLIDTGAVVDRVTFQDAPTSKSQSIRGHLYRTTPEIIVDHPIFGVGADNFRTVSNRYGLIEYSSSVPHAHNILLNVGAELGLLGLAALLWLAVALLRLLARLCRTATGMDQAFAYAIAGAFIGLAAEGLVDYVLSVNVNTGVVFVLAGCAAVLARLVPEQLEETGDDEAAAQPAGDLLGSPRPADAPA